MRIDQLHDVPDLQAPPFVGPFLRECYGCKRDLFDLQARNEAEAARLAAALATIGIGQSARIVSTVQLGTTLIVNAEQPDAYFRYTVDVFRLPTLDEIDPEQADPRTPGEWILIDPLGDHAPEAVDRMIRDAIGRLDELGLTADVPTDALLAALAA
ncbi:hypothetical protein [Streptomyces sp. NBC_00568]|uniref:hypothetical protein n=1 Tax=Streptomyces sp. NBC_00568 TaxID=2975779 RepID=UPI00224F047D|nr:hypothetical protein [Streptomyces sp. NBC_00568]MCX4993434.1 hypothetical protein [Streptomyces sp. NBC_00568]